MNQKESVFQTLILISNLTFYFLQLVFKRSKKVHVTLCHPLSEVLRIILNESEQVK